MRKFILVLAFSVFSFPSLASDTGQFPDPGDGNRYILGSYKSDPTEEAIEFVRFVNHSTSPFWEWEIKPKVDGVDFEVYLEDFIRETLPSGAHINDGSTNAATNLSASSVEILGINVPTNSSYTALVSAHNDLATKYNDLSTKYNTLLDRLEAQGLLNAS